MEFHPKEISLNVLYNHLGEIVADFGKRDSLNGNQLEKKFFALKHVCDLCFMTCVSC